MYVKIKKPKHWVTTYKWKFFDYLEKKIGEEKADKITDVAQSVVNWTWNFPRRAGKDSKPKIKINYWDTWSMDCTLAPIIEPMLKQLKETKQGSPFVDDEDVPDELKSVNAAPLTEEEQNQGYVDNNHHKRWEWVLNEMIWAFEQKNTYWEEQYHSGKIDKVFTPIKTENGTELYRWDDGPNHTHKIDWDGYKAHQKRISNGFRLFGKYFEALWD